MSAKVTAFNDGPVAVESDNLPELGVGSDERNAEAQTIDHAVPALCQFHGGAKLHFEDETDN